MMQLSQTHPRSLLDTVYLEETHRLSRPDLGCLGILIGYVDLFANVQAILPIQRRL